MGVWFVEFGIVLGFALCSLVGILFCGWFWLLVCVDFGLLYGGGVVGFSCLMCFCMYFR